MKHGCGSDGKPGVFPLPSLALVPALRELAKLNPEDPREELWKKV